MTYVAAPDAKNDPLTMGSIHMPKNCVFLGYQEESGAYEYLCHG